MMSSCILSGSVLVCLDLQLLLLVVWAFQYEMLDCCLSVSTPTVQLRHENSIRTKVFDPSYFKTINSDEVGSSEFDLAQPEACPIHPWHTAKRRCEFGWNNGEDA